MVAALDITGQRYGLLVAITRVGTNKRGRAIWLFRCDCGNQVSRITDGLSRHENASCGCYKSGWGNKGRSPASKTHGLSRTRLYRVYNNMMGRCHSPKNHRFADYGGRGITVCAEWHRAAPFLEWAQSNGYSDDLQLDRIDNDKGYSPGNCRFVTPKQNMSNMRTSVNYTIAGETLTGKEVEQRYGVPRSTMRHRTTVLGMTADEAATTPRLSRSRQPLAPWI